MNDRDMYYNSYGYSGFSPMNYIPNQMFPNVGMPINDNSFSGISSNTYMSSQFNDINERVSRLERQVKRLEQRLTRIETPYANVSNFNSEPDNNMYMM